MYFKKSCKEGKLYKQCHNTQFFTLGIFIASCVGRNIILCTNVRFGHYMHCNLFISSQYFVVTKDIRILRDVYQ